MTNKIQNGNEHVAVAKALDCMISTKHSIEISNAIRNKNTTVAKNFLENVVKFKQAVPFKRYLRNVGHKRNMAAGRYPQKAAKEFLKLLKSVEANAQLKGLDPSNLKIIKIISNLASIPFSGGRRRRATKRTNIEIAVKEGEVINKNKNDEKKAFVNKKDTENNKKTKSETPEVKQ